MTSKPDPSTAVEKLEELAATPDLAEALESDRFKQFLDHVPVAILVGESPGGSEESIVYANLEAEELLGLKASDLQGGGWSQLDDRLESEARSVSALLAGEDQIFRSALRSVADGGSPDRRVEINSVLVTDQNDRVRFRLVALIDVSGRDDDREAFEALLRDKDVLLREIQHRVKNNLQIITTLIRMEARRAGDQIGQGAFERLAGRIEALGLLYRQLEFAHGDDVVDLGALLSQIAGAVMKAQAVDGVRLDLQVEPCPTGINLAMPIGLLVNELLTNAMKYAFEGRPAGVVAVRCLKDGDDGCEVAVSDDGVGMAEGTVWPQPGKLGALLVRSLEDNTQASVTFARSSEGGVATTIRFRLTRSAARGARP
jgi:PAS domain S-box-containing protein